MSAKPAEAIGHDLELRVKDLSTTLSEIKITDTTSYQLAASGLQLTKKMLERIDTDLDDIIKDAFNAHRGLTGLKSKYRQPLLAEERRLKDLMLQWDAHQELLAKQEQARLQLEANERAERHLLLDAEDREASGDQEGALAMLEGPVLAPIVRIQPDVPKVAGIAYKTVYSAEVTDLKVLVAAVAAGTVPLRALQPDMVFIRGQAKALREDLHYAGVKVIATRDIAAGSR